MPLRQTTGEVMENESQNLLLLIKACQNQNRLGQKKLYQLFYSYAMSICMRYARNKDEAHNILNDAFYKMFSKIDQFDPALSFKPWLRVILINTAIDYHRKFHKMEPFKELSTTDNYGAVQNDGWDNLLYDDVMECVQQLSPQYKLVFNLFAIDGFSHQEISEELGITIGTSKSNYFKARKKLQELCKENYPFKRYSDGQ